MSQIGQTTPSNLSEGLPITSLALLVILLIPCVVLLLLMNCLFLGYKLLILSKKRQKRDDTEEMLLQSTLSTRHRVSRVSETPFSLNEKRKTNCVSLSEPILSHPVTSSRTSSKEPAAADQRIRFTRPDGATETGSLRAPSTILAVSSTTGSTSRACPPKKSQMYDKSRMAWCRSAPVIPQSSDSEVDTGPNLVPPNSPEVHDPLSMASPELNHIRRSSTLELLMGVNHDSAEHLFDKVDFECEYTSSIPAETSYLNASTVGPGHDSDFGASAGVSLRILSADSDGLSSGVLLSSALEWDYYDPCYVRQNNIPKHKHHRPALHTKQYWV